MKNNTDRRESHTSNARVRGPESKQAGLTQGHAAACKAQPRSTECLNKAERHVLNISAHKDCLTET
jgi:hypothetical protein